MDSVQRLRQQAQKAGNLKSNEQIKVSTQPRPRRDDDGGAAGRAPPQYIVIEPAQPSVVYVPAYNPAVVYGAVALSGLSAVLLSAAARLLVLADGRHRHRLGRRHRNLECALGRLQLGPRRREHQRQPLQQHQCQPADQRQRQPLVLEPQSRASQDRLSGRQRDAPESRAQERGGRSRAVPRQGRQPGREPRPRRAVDAVARREHGAGIGARSRAGGEPRGRRRRRARSRANRGPGGGRTWRRARIATPRGRAQSADRSAAQQRAQSASRDNALRGAGDGQARQQADRGAASRQSAQQRPQQAPRASTGGGGASRPSGGGGGARGRRWRGRWTWRRRWGWWSRWRWRTAVIMERIDMRSREHTAERCG